MKKLVFMALATVFMVSSGFVGQGRSSAGDCTITYTETIVSMTGTYEIEHTFTISGLNYFQCKKLQDLYDKVFSLEDDYRL
jgi:hypothetical protein